MIKEIKIIESAKLSNLLIITFYGLADGTLLNKSNNANSVLNNYIKIRTIDFDYYSTNTNWIDKEYYDNNAFGQNANTRYSLLRPYSKLDLKRHAFVNLTNGTYYNLLLDKNVLPLFPDYNNSGAPFFLPIGYPTKAIEHIEINGISDAPIRSAIDMKVYCQMYDDFDAGNVNSPYVIVTMLIEKLGNKLNDVIQF